MTTGTRCPACGCMVRPDAGWCSLCHADLRSEEEKAAARPPEPWSDETVEAPAWAHVPSSALADDPSTASTADAAAAAALAADRRGRHARPSEQAPEPSGHDVRTAPDVTSALGVTTTHDVARSAVVTSADAALIKAGVDVDAMMSLLAADQAKPLPALSGRLANKGNRAIAAVLAVVTLTAVGVVVMTVLGMFLH